MPSDGERRERVVVLQHLGHRHGPPRANLILQSVFRPRLFACTSRSPPRVRACARTSARMQDRRRCTHARGCAMRRCGHALRRVALYIAWCSVSVRSVLFAFSASASGPIPLQPICTNVTAETRTVTSETRTVTAETRTVLQKHVPYAWLITLHR